MTDYDNNITPVICQDFFDKKIYFLPATPGGKPLCRDIEKGRIRDIKSLQKWIDRGFTRFICRPCSGGLIVLDLDKHADQPDGVKEFKKLTGINPEQHPYYVQTPGGGVHLYYQSDGADYISSPIASGCEVKFRAFVTIPGSISDRGEYIPVGNFKDIPPLPESLKGILKIKNIEQPHNKSDVYVRDHSIDELAATIARNDGLYFQKGARNSTAFSLARYCRKRGKDQSDVINWITANYGNQDFTQREITAAVKSAYNR